MQSARSSTVSFWNESFAPGDFPVTIHECQFSARPRCGTLVVILNIRKLVGSCYGRSDESSDCSGDFEDMKR